MPFTVGELRTLLAEHHKAGDTSRALELDGGRAGWAEVFRPLFPDGLLRATDCETDPQTLSLHGLALTTLSTEPARVRVAFADDGGPEITGVSLHAGLPTLVPMSTLVQGLGVGWEVSALPTAATVRQVELRQQDGVFVLSGTGGSCAVTVVGHEGAGRLLLARCDGWQVLCADRDVPRRQLSPLVGAVGLDGVVPDADLPGGTWLTVPRVQTSAGAGRQKAPEGHASRSGGWAATSFGSAFGGGADPVMIPVRGARRSAAVDARRRDGLGRPLPLLKEAGVGAAPGSSAGGSGPWRGVYAVAVGDGFVVVAPGALGHRQAHRFRLSGPRGPVATGLSFPDFGDLVDGEHVTVTYDKPPLYVSGGLAAKKAEPPYALVAGGVLIVDTKSFSGSAVAAAYLPTSGNRASFFAFGALTADKGIGPPAFQVRGVAGGMGWRSNLRLPSVEELADFPFLQALDDPTAIGAGPDGSADPMAVLDTLATGAEPWITPAGGGEDPLWITAGLGFTIAERLDGRAMLVLQTGQDLTFALLGIAGMRFPKEPGRRRYANVELGLEAVLKPRAGELTLAAQLTPNSFLLDENCRLRGGVAFKTWFGPSTHKGDFVVTLGGYHRNYKRPDHYPTVPRLGFDWDLSGKVTVSGEAYFALTPAAVMAGGGLDVRFSSGALHAWLTARVDALIQWKPFYFDVGLHVSVGVQARIKIWFVKITITVEVGVALRVWGPPTGGEARIKLWFVSFTIGFGRGRDADTHALDWPGFRTMLPPRENTLRLLPLTGLLPEAPGADGTRGADAAWQVATSGFSFATDSAMPITEVYLAAGGGSAVETGSRVDIRPMDRRGLTSVHRVWITLEGETVDLQDWARTASTTSVPKALWGSGDDDPLDGGDELVGDQLTGIALASPATPDYGHDTGYIGEDAIAFDPIAPDGTQPLDPSAPPAGPAPDRPGGVIEAIVQTVNAPAQRDARGQLAAALEGFGVGLGALDSDLSAYARAAETAFTAEPMLLNA
ncbi:DUF6603 domain-containing protein [Streptomyces noursei]|uniref:DUF6603 domain-containing protein n=1 Tax=Streptomyces noursei TaxID=1971 RepID=UPI00380BFFAE